MATGADAAEGSAFAQDGIFRCPVCHAALDSATCARCGFVVEVVDGIPLLVRDRATVAAAIETAKASGRAQWYEGRQDEQFEGAYRHHLAKRRAYLDDVLTQNRRACPGPLRGLDLGCGDGGHLVWLARYVDTLYASDFNFDRLPFARMRGVARRVFMADVTNYPAGDDAFDVIFLNHVLEHIVADEAALAEAHRILKPGGLLVLGVPNEGAFFWQLAYRLQPRTREHTDHVQFYTAATLAAKCQAAGFRVRHVEHIGWGVPHWGLDERLRQWRLVDDFFTVVGRALIPRQATSLYLLLGK